VNYADTSFLIALKVRRDIFHDAAFNFYEPRQEGSLKFTAGYPANTRFNTRSPFVETRKSLID
jgi:hypothetical protein